MSSWGVVPFVCSAALLAGAYLLWFLDRYRWEPLGRFLLTTLLGVCAGALARVAAAWAGSALQGSPVELAPDALSAGLTGIWSPRQVLLLVLQQTLCLLVLLLFARRAYLEGPLDGAISGAAVAVGASLPALGLRVVAGDPTLPWAGTFAVLAAACGGVVLGGSVGRGALSGRAERLIGWGAVGALLSVAVTWVAAASWLLCGGGAFAWRWTELIAPVLAAGVLVGLSALVLLAERRILERQLAEEAEYGVLPEWAVRTVSCYRRRVRAAWWPRGDERSALVRVMVTLAFKKEQLERLVPEARSLYGLEVGRLRQRLRGMLAGTGPHPGEEWRGERSDTAP